MISRDITERKARERQLERQNERLEQFASVVSHDLRNPLTVAESALDLISDDVTAANEDHLEKPDRSLARMDDIIEDVLTLAVQGQTVTDPEPVSLERMVEDAWRYVECDSATLGNVTDARLRADPGRLQQLLGNLFRNADEHGGGDLTVTVGLLDGAAGFYVEDDGVGVGDDDPKSLFELGYSTAESGTGLGLAIVDQIASAHGWTVAYADDAPGARFEITGVDLE
jgi:signal transduction histidine kinase